MVPIFLILIQNWRKRPHKLLEFSLNNFSHNTRKAHHFQLRCHWVRVAWLRWGWLTNPNSSWIVLKDKRWQRVHIWIKLMKFKAKFRMHYLRGWVWRISKLIIWCRWARHHREFKKHLMMYESIYFQIKHSLAILHMIVFSNDKINWILFTDTCLQTEYSTNPMTICGEISAGDGSTHLML